MLVTVYDAEGIAHQKETVDARECVEHCGFTREPPEIVTAEAPVEVPAGAVEQTEASETTADSAVVKPWLK